MAILHLFLHSLDDKGLDAELMLRVVVFQEGRVGIGLGFIVGWVLDLKLLLADEVEVLIRSELCLRE